MGGNIAAHFLGSLVGSLERGKFRHHARNAKVAQQMLVEMRGMPVAFQLELQKLYGGGHGEILNSKF